MTATAKPAGPIAAGTLLTHAQAALTDLRASQSYKQYKANGTLPQTKLGACERELLALIAELGG